ncbi:MAG TPA: helix-turn-helix transcriptional regulator [Verrucomicrobiae bacterium]
MPTNLKHRKSLGDAIRTNRKRLKLSQEQLAEKADLHPVYISAVERGAKTISVDTLMRIAKVLGVRLRDLVAEI